MAAEKTEILIVEDDISILPMMQQMLELEGYEVLTAVNGETALKVFDNCKPSLILLDIGLPDINGISVCKKIREFSGVPIIMVTGKSEIEDKVVGLQAGADDYITKPFSYDELIARVSAVLRRTAFPEKHPTRPVFQCRQLKIDFNRQVVTVDEQRVDLTITEYRILVVLAEHAGAIVSSHALLKEVWGSDYGHALHLLQVNVSRLRQKINDNDPDHKYIESKPGHGYILNTF